MTANQLEVMLLVVAVENRIGAVVLKILVEDLEIVVREVEVEEDHDVVQHEEETGKLLTTSRYKK